MNDLPETISRKRSAAQDRGSEETKQAKRRRTVDSDLTTQWQPIIRTRKMRAKERRRGHPTVTVEIKSPRSVRSSRPKPIGDKSKSRTANSTVKGHDETRDGKCDIRSFRMSTYQDPPHRPCEPRAFDAAHRCRSQWECQCSGELLPKSVAPSEIDVAIA